MLNSTAYLAGALPFVFVLYTLTALVSVTRFTACSRPSVLGVVGVMWCVTIATTLVYLSRAIEVTSRELESVASSAEQFSFELEECIVNRIVRISLLPSNA
jgi:hypothetical protein